MVHIERPPGRTGKPRDNGELHPHLVLLPTEKKPNLLVTSGLGEPQYEPESSRINGFCGKIIESVDDYRHYLATDVFPAAKKHGATRIIDRVIMKSGLFVRSEGLEFPMATEAVINLGGQWEGYDWVMNGVNLPGRQLSGGTRRQLLSQAREAGQLSFARPQGLPEGFMIGKISATTISSKDMADLADIFRGSLNGSTPALESPEQVRTWLDSANMYPVVVRNQDGQIILIANGTITRTTLEGREFRFFEIGDPAAHPDHDISGINRHLVHFLLGEAVKMHFDSIHAETPASQTAPNVANSKNGMTYSGTLWSNSRISGHEDIPESSDPNLHQDFRRIGSMNIWSMTQRNPLWRYYEDYLETARQPRR